MWYTAIERREIKQENIFFYLSILNCNEYKNNHFFIYVFYIEETDRISFLLIRFSVVLPYNFTERKSVYT